jgi:hypothetical protein
MYKKEFEGVKISEVDDLDLEEYDVAMIYGLVLDNSEIPDFDPKIEEVSLIAKFDEDGKIDDDVIDVAITLALSQKFIILEIPFAEQKRLAGSIVNDLPFEKYLVVSCANMNSSLAILPPEDDSEENFKIYSEVLCDVTEYLFRQTNMNKYVFPINNYLEYLFLSYVIEIDIAEPNDYFTKSRYFDVLKTERSNAFKLDIKNRIISIFGSDNKFEEYVLKNIASVSQRMKSYCENTMLDKESYDYMKDAFSRDKKKDLG